MLKSKLESKITALLAGALQSFSIKTLESNQYGHTLQKVQGMQECVIILNFSSPEAIAFGEGKSHFF